MAKNNLKTQKKSSVLLSKLFIIFTILFLFFLLYQLLALTKTKFVRYEEFGIDIPVNYSIHGIDVSWHNGNIDWKEVKEMNIRGIKIHFAFMKATEGSSMQDPQFNRNWKQAKKYKIVRGAYHFFNEFKSGKEQAEHFIKTVGDLSNGDLPPVLDIEENRGVTKEQLIKEAKTWLNIVEQHYKVKPIIYTYVNFYSNQLSNAFDSYPFWAAHYNEKQQPKTSRSWQIWQHSESANVNGITSKVDFNAFKGNIWEFNQLLVN